MRLLLPLLVVICLTACSSTQYLTYPALTEPVATVLPQPQKMLVLHTVDATMYHARKNKEDLVQQLADTLVKNISQQLSQNAGLAVHALYGTTPLTASGDSSLDALMDQSAATHALMIRQIDVYFDQTEVQVTKTATGKSREAFYDICTLIAYDFRSREQSLEQVAIRHCQPHSSRAVISGLLAAGPSLGSNNKAFYALALENKALFLNRFFPGTMVRKRFVHTAAPFSPVGKALRQNNYTLALEESLKWSESGNKDIAAKALYNCAVFSERNQDVAAARRYLDQSLRKQWTEAAAAMKESMNP